MIINNHNNWRFVLLSSHSSSLPHPPLWCRKQNNVPYQNKTIYKDCCTYTSSDLTATLPLGNNCSAIFSFSWILGKVMFRKQMLVVTNFCTLGGVNANCVWNEVQNIQSPGESCIWGEIQYCGKLFLWGEYSLLANCFCGKVQSRGELFLIRSA